MPPATPPAMPIDVIVCETCRPPSPDTAPNTGTDTDTGDAWTGAAFAALLRGALATAGDVQDISVSTMRCLMSCRRPCAVVIRSPDRMSYVLGDLPPEPGAVEALLAYLSSYRRSADGIVPYRDWPAGVKGRFVARIPPLPSR